MLFLIKVHKIACFFKKTLKTLEKSTNIMYLCKGGWNRRFCSFEGRKMHPAWMQGVEFTGLRTFTDVK